MSLLDFFKKGKKQIITEFNSVGSLSSWYQERYDRLSAQRNTLLVLVILCFIAVAASSIAVINIANSRKFSPFVIQVEKDTGEAIVVNPISTTVLSGDDQLNRFFIKKYVTARETYNSVDFNTLTKKTIRLMSPNNIYRQYLGYIRNEETDPSIIYGTENTTYLTVRSWSRIEDKKYIFRFSITETEKDMLSVNKIAVVSIDYVPMELTEKERDINPVGFQVTAYRVDDDNS